MTNEVMFRRMVNVCLSMSDVLHEIAELRPDLTASREPEPISDVEFWRKRAIESERKYQELKTSMEKP